jgi:RHS repeat-associated protein
MEYYDETSSNLLESMTFNVPPLDTNGGPSLAEQRMLYTAPGAVPVAQLYAFNQLTIETTTYNFMGNKLSDEVVEGLEGEVMPNFYVTYRDATTCYAYWDGSKYFQQKAVMDPGGRFTYVDYYPSTAPPGTRGQQYQAFDNAHAGFYLNTSITPPSYASPSDYWKYQLTPTAGQYTAQFAYDSVGRCTDVYKLQSTTTSPWTYVHTQTTYGANTDGSWGQANTVVEDQGGINRLTQTKAYTAWGKACDVVDAAGHEYVTGYDLDGNVLGVTRTDSGLNQMIAAYSYGTSGVSNGRVISSTDGLSGVNDSTTYQPSGYGAGQVAQVTESGGPNPSYSVNYAYNSGGERWRVTYATVNGTKQWQYDDYYEVCYGANLKRVPQTLTLLDQYGNPTSEQLQYAYDTAGRLIASGFAQTPAAGFTPSTGSPWYDSGHLPSSRARASYSYDCDGRIFRIEHDWDVWNGSGYTTTGVLQNNCTYEFSGLNRGVKTASQFNVWNDTGWAQDHQESYSYDPSLDYLVGANYGDGLPNATPSWSYDAAGNRTDSVCDNLNRTTSIGGQPTTCDILGNRLSLGSSIAYGWDCLNRMTSNANGGVSNSYWYRLDGMRVGKLAGSTGTTTTYAYDGQMGFEDEDRSGTGATVTEYGLGARGIDYIAANNGIKTTVGFPLYDSHGDMVCCLFRGVNGAYSLDNERSYDAWGSVREGGATGDPKGRYSANLGHKADDESGLIYMRARFLEPQSGRFISQDPHFNGSNYFVYADNDPVGKVDRTGNNPFELALILGMILGFLIGAYEEVAEQKRDVGAVYNWDRVIAKGGVGAVIATYIEADIAIICALAPLGVIGSTLGAVVLGNLINLEIATIELLDDSIDRAYPRASPGEQIIY